MKTEPYAIPRPAIRRLCIKCHVTWADVEHHYIVVSPRGTAHFPRPWGETECKLNADGPRWWWPL